MKMINIDLKKIKGVVFDMDGTMIDNAAYHIKTWQEFCKKYNLKFDLNTYQNKYSGGTNDLILPDLFGKKLTLKEIEKYAKEKEALYRKIYKPFIREVNGLSNLVKKIKTSKLKIAVATSSIDENRDFALKQLGFKKEDFDVIIGPSQVKNKKPEPEIYLKTARLLKIDPQYLVAFEDSPKGVQSAKSAGLTVYALLTSHTKEDLHLADEVIEDFNEVSLG